MDFYAEKDMAACGLACVLCGDTACPGCKARGCQEGDICGIYRCAAGKGLDGCYQCDEFPCKEPMLQGIRIQAFNLYAKQYGKQELLERLAKNNEAGITYHIPGGQKGDYDQLSNIDDIIKLIQFGTLDPFEKCPTLESEQMRG